MISIGTNRNHIEQGDFLELLNDAQLWKCKAKVLRVKKKRALISLEKCGFKITKKIRVRPLNIEDELLSLSADDIWDDESNWSGHRGVTSQDQGKSRLIEIERESYVSGGVIGTIFGVGIGHGVQGRWSRDGWGFTVSQILTASLYLSATSEYDSCLAESDTLYGIDRCEDGSGIWALGLLISRVMEIVSLCSPARNKYKIVKNSSENQFFSSPVLGNSQVGLIVGFTF